MDDDGFPFLFINGGAATLSSSAPAAAAMVRDTVIQREIQSLEHTGIHHLYPPMALLNVRISDRWPLHLCDGTSQFRSRIQTDSLYFFS